MDHAILLGKLRLYGVDCLSFKSFGPYLSDRRQQTFIDGGKSDFCNVTCDVNDSGLKLNLAKCI